MSRIKSNYYVKNELKCSLGISILVISIPFIAIGLLEINIASLFDQYYQIPDKQFVNYTRIDYGDPNPSVNWLENESVFQSDLDPLQVGNDIGLTISANSKIIPQQLIAHIFHEDLLHYFSDPDGDYRKQTKEVNDVYTLRYNNIFYVKFNTTESCSQIKKTDGEIETECNFSSFTHRILTKPGKYYIQFSTKINNKTDHYLIPESIFEVDDTKTAYILKSFAEIKQDIEDKKGEALRNLGYAHTSIGLGMLASGITLLADSISRKEKPPFYR
ncbi:MAG: hypothetical protein EPO62_00420 [Candidatus Nitrosotenuis sp.]|nr:MAG: hypothetical protein EPO62_00420 [Candidatus Nitrosotenuis sp.]